MDGPGLNLLLTETLVLAANDSNVNRVLGIAGVRTCLEVMRKASKLSSNDDDEYQLIAPSNIPAMEVLETALVHKFSKEALLDNSIKNIWVSTFDEVDALNDSVSLATGGLIPKIVAAEDALSYSKAMLISRSEIRGKWQVPLVYSGKKEFHTGSNVKNVVYYTAPTNLGMNLIVHQDMDVLVLDFDQSKMRAVIMKPNEPARNHKELWRAIFRDDKGMERTLMDILSKKAETETYDIYLPLFNFEYECDVSSILKEFSTTDRNKMDKILSLFCTPSFKFFQNMQSIQSEYLTIKSSAHVVFNKTGISVSSKTMMVMVDDISRKSKVYFDKPFIVMILDGRQTSLDDQIFNVCTVFNPNGVNVSPKKRHIKEPPPVKKAKSHL